MTVRIETIDAVRTLAGLVKSLIGEKQPKEVQERVQEELLRANPWLGGVEGLKPGMTIIVPDLGEPPADSGNPAQPGAAPAPGPVRTGIEAAIAVTGTQLEASLAAANEQSQTLRSKKTQDALLAAYPELTKEQLDAVAKQAEEEAAQTAAVVEQFRQGLEDAMMRLPRR
jgi:hypothetical protein